MWASRQTGLLLLRLGGEAHFWSLGQSKAYPPPIEPNGLEIIECRRDEVLYENGLGGKEPK